MKPIVFIPEPIAECGIELLSPHCECITPWKNEQETERSSLYEAEAVIVRLFSVDKQDIDKSKQLKVIAKHGVGVDNIDVKAATTAGIPVVSTPRANANAVAEHTLTLMLALARQIGPASMAIHQGGFSDRGSFQGTELEGKTLGIIGLGNVGQRVARISDEGVLAQVHKEVRRLRFGRVVCGAATRVGLLCS